MHPLAKRRAFGQHFLRDNGVINTIAETALSEAAENGAHTLLEIGPGRGAITHAILEKLLERPRPRTLPLEHFLLCEKDRDLAARWRTEIIAKAPPLGPCLTLEEGDFLDLPPERWCLKAPVQVVSNLPYSSGTAIFDRLARRPEVPGMVLMFQLEVAARLRAEVSTSAWGSLSVWTQNEWDVRTLVAVPPRAFIPPPKVNSEVVIFNRRKTPRIVLTRPEGGSAELWEKLLRTAFAHKRKMLRSGLPPGPYRNALELSGLDGTKRAEALHWSDWDRLYSALISI